MHDWEVGELSLQSEVETQGEDDIGAIGKESSEEETLATIRINLTVDVQQ